MDTQAHETKVAAGWAADPSGRHDLRFWDGTNWTGHVIDGGVPGVDPVPARPSPPAQQEADAQPQTEPNQTKPIWKRWWAIATAVFVLLGVLGSAMPKDKPATVAAARVAGKNADVASSSPDFAVTVATTPPATAPPDTTPPPTAPPATAPRATTPRVTAPPVTVPPAPVDSHSGETVSQKNARQKAASYLEFTSFSRSGLIDQLKYEGFSEPDATYGTDAQNADWFEQAAKKAASYMEFTSFSRQGLIEQLEYDGFTAPQAEHGADSVGL